VSGRKSVNYKYSWEKQQFLKQYNEIRKCVKEGLFLVHV